MWGTSIYLAEAMKMLKLLEDKLRIAKKNHAHNSFSGAMEQLHVLLNNDNWKILFELGCMLPHAVAYAEKKYETEGTDKRKGTFSVWTFTIWLGKME